MTWTPLPPTLDSNWEGAGTTRGTEVDMRYCSELPLAHHLPVECLQPPPPSTTSGVMWASKRASGLGHDEGEIDECVLKPGESDAHVQGHKRAR